MLLRRPPSKAGQAGAGVFALIAAISALNGAALLEPRHALWMQVGLGAPLGLLAPLFWSTWRT